MRQTISCPTQQRQAIFNHVLCHSTRWDLNEMTEEIEILCCKIMNGFQRSDGFQYIKG